MEQEKCKQFIESLVSFFEWDQRADEWEIKTNLKLKIMTMSIKKKIMELLLKMKLSLFTIR